MSLSKIVIVITGPQGVGKSRLAEALGRALTNYSGAVEVDGDDPRPSTVTRLSADVCRENTRRDIESALEFIGCGNKIVIRTSNE